jgi:hypothetical protein
MLSNVPRFDDIRFIPGKDCLLYILICKLITGPNKPKDPLDLHESAGDMSAGDISDGLSPESKKKTGLSSDSDFFILPNNGVILSVAKCSSGMDLFGRDILFCCET